MTTPIRWFLEEPNLEMRNAADDTDSPGVISGYVIRWGESANIGFGYKESVQKGAFGDISNAALIANYMHQRAQPLGRTQGSGLEMTADDTGVYAELTLPDTQRGRDTATEVRNRILRGLSIEFYIDKANVDEKAKTVVHTKARLLGFGVVDIPAYRRSVPKIREGELVVEEDDAIVRRFALPQEAPSQDADAAREAQDAPSPELGADSEKEAPEVRQGDSPEGQTSLWAWGVF